jgi:20S proteasome alpha/beta subunit
MTLVVGFVSQDCGVMGADSQATEADGTRSQVEKIWEDSGLLFGYTGTWAVRDLVASAILRAVVGCDPHADREQIQKKLCNAVRPVLMSVYANYVPNDVDEAKRRLGGRLLVMGCDAKGHWLLEIDENNTGSSYTDRGFHAIGSGSPAAQVAIGLLQNYNPQRLSPQQLQMLAYRTIDVSISVLAQHLSGPVRLWSSNDSRQFVQLTDTALDETAKRVELWLGIERESLDEASSPPAGDDLPQPVGEESPPAATDMPEALRRATRVEES